MTYLPQKLTGLLRMRHWAMCAAVFTILSCGGETQVAGIEGTGDTAVSAGSISGFGSVYVNGTRYDTAAATITLDGQPAAEDDLALGMVVTIKGTRDPQSDQGVATEIDAEIALRGPVTAVNTAEGDLRELTVLGQQVVAQPETVLDGIEYGEFALGQVIEVSGFTDGDGRWLATHIALAGEPTEAADFRVQGRVMGINHGQARIDINGLAIDASGVGFAAFAVGDRIQIEGAELNSGGELVANQISQQAGLSLTAGAAVELEGLIEDFNSVAQFSVDGTFVNAADARVLKGSRQQLSDGVRVSVAGTATVEGELKAETIELLLPSQVRVVGPVDVVDVDQGRLEVLGTTFMTDRRTAYEDRSQAANRRINLSQLSLGDQVEVLAREIDGSYVITRVRRHNGQQHAPLSIEGRVVEVIDATSFHLLGLVIDASAAQGQEALSGLEAGDLIRVEGRLTGTSLLLADRVQLLPRAQCLRLPAWLDCVLPGNKPQ